MREIAGGNERGGKREKYRGGIGCQGASIGTAAKEAERESSKHHH